MIDFRIQNDRLGLLSVTSSDNAIRCEKENDYTCSIGVGDKPLFGVIAPVSPMDEPWHIYLKDTGQWPRTNSAHEGLDPTFLDWARTSRAVHGLDILNYLPIGDYHIIRSPIEPILQDRVTIGNEIIENSDRVYTLLDSEQFQMLIFSSMPKMPADLTQPLIGVPMLHSMGCNGTGKCNAIFFFPFGNPAGTETSSVGDLLLVVPLTGELVVETGGVLIKNRKVDNDRLNRWQRDEAPMLVSRLVLL